jgi:hypothetical protein
MQQSRSVIDINENKGINIQKKLDWISNFPDIHLPDRISKIQKQLSLLPIPLTTTWMEENGIISCRLLLSNLYIPLIS